MLKSKTSRTGALGEEIAARFLERKGFRVAERNYRKPWGEIDIIAEKAGIVRFIEVKAVMGDLELFSRQTIHTDQRSRYIRPNSKRS